jgi:hypothetical protein
LLKKLIFIHKGIFASNYYRQVESNMMISSDANAETHADADGAKIYEQITKRHRTTKNRPLLYQPIPPPVRYNGGSRLQMQRGKGNGAALLIEVRNVRKRKGYVTVKVEVEGMKLEKLLGGN